MEDQIPPPKALVIVAHLSEEERRETEQNGKYLYFGRYLNGKAGFQHDGHRHRQHDPGHQEDVDPLLLDGQENELRCHHGLSGDEDDEMSEPYPPFFISLTILHRQVARKSDWQGKNVSASVHLVGGRTHNKK